MTDTRVIRRRSNQILWLALAIIVILAAGIIVTLYVAHQQDAAMRQELLTKTRLGFITADSQKIPLLTGSDADLTSPAYLEIKNQLATIRTADPEVRFAYFIGQHPDGTYFIFVDSEDPESPDYSPPGQEYTEISEDVKQVFVTDRETTVGPYTDRWGSWVSGYVPLHDPVSGRTIAIFGMDHNAGNWNGQILREALLPGTATLVALLMLLVFFEIQQRTERERRRLELSERARSESERNFRAFFETIGDMIVVATPEGRIVFANTALERILGYNTEELARMHLLDLHPADLRSEAEAIFSLILKGERNTCPLPMMAKNGVQVPVETRVWYGTWDGKDCIFSIVKDLTTEREAEQRFERLFRNNPALMVLSTLPDRKFTDVNDAFLARLGYTRDEVVGKTSVDFHLFPDPAQQKAAADQLQQNGRITDLELQVRCRDGSILDGIFSGEVIHSQGRQYFLTVMIDVTERKELEREKEYHEQELVRYSEELNRDIAERKKVEQALTEVNKKLNMLSSITRHDILNQLTVILGYIALLEETQPDPVIAEKFWKIETAAERITTMIRFTKEYENIGVQTPIWQDLRVLVDTASKQAPLGQVQIRNELPSGTIVFADPLISKVFFNLVDNAIRHGDTLTEIRFSAEEREGALTIICEDDGVGIPLDTKERIFDRGFGANTGLGLFLSREILAITGITIRETGEPGKGARFEIVISNEGYRFSQEL